MTRKPDRAILVRRYRALDERRIQRALQAETARLGLRRGKPFQVFRLEGMTGSSFLVRFLEPSEVVAFDVPEDGTAIAAWADTFDLDAWLRTPASS
jgi:hypothetical protein